MRYVRSLLKMQFQNIICVVLVLLLKCVHSSKSQYIDVPSSPCPQLFQYKYNGTDWIGELELPSPPVDHHEVILQITLSLKAASQPENDGVIKTVGSSQEVTEKILAKRPLMFHVLFPFRHPLPKLVRIVYDNSLLCTGPEEQLSPNMIVTRIDLKHKMNTSTNYQPGGNNLYDNTDYNPWTTIPTPPPSSRPQSSRPPSSSWPRPTTTTQAPVQTQPAFVVPSSDVNSICGTRHSETEITPFIGGEETQRGDWPWIVAVYVNQASSLAFNCVGTLISSKSVITAAHCINTPEKNYRANEILLHLGRFSLSDWFESGTVQSNVEEVFVHTDYKKHRDSFDADIAILIMIKRVEFNEFVRPACLWPGTSSIQEIEGQKGVVVGWGKNSLISNIRRKLDLPIVNPSTCVQTSESLSKAVSNRTFCAGTLNGDGPCHGDSGGGLILYHNDRWTLRGIISTGLADPNTGRCKLMDYVVFTDVTYFTSWIRTHGQF